MSKWRMVVASLHFEASGDAEKPSVYDGQAEMSLILDVHSRIQLPWKSLGGEDA